jgi:hypothetical protein
MKKILLALVLSVVPASGASLNSLYFGLDNMRGFSEVYWWFLADGRVLHGLPTTGLTPADFENACAKNPGFCGTYTLSGDKLVIQYRGGKAETWTYKPLDGGFQMNYIILTPVEKYRANTRLNGNWDRPFSSKFGSPSSQITVTSPTFLSFRADGTFSERNVTGVESHNVNSAQTTQGGGTYTISDNVLILVRNGKSERHMIFPVAGGSLNIDGLVYKKAN